MSNIVIKATDISKQYRLGLVGSGSLKDDISRFFAKMIGKEDPTLKVGQVNDRTKKGESDYVWALKNINFEVRQGEILGIIGKNGAGKSTLLKILSKITAPTTGSIKVKGRIASLLEVGTGFHAELTGRENVYLNGAILGMRREEVTSKLDEIIDFAGIARYIDTPVKRYSSGMTVRLGFAVAAHLEPEILVVDEVLAVGDAEFQKKAIGKMQDISKDGGRTVLFVSHNMASIQNLCTRCVVLENGETTFEGNTDRAIDYYLQGGHALQAVPINERTDRDGKADKIKVTSIYITNTENQLISGVYSGQSFCICMDYEANFYDDNFLKKVNPSISILNKDGVSLVLHHSRLDGKLFDIKQKTGKFIVKVDSIPLVPSIYQLSFGVVEAGQMLDGLSNAMELQVMDGDYYKVGEVPPDTHGYLLLNANWSMQ
jgi:lipopolysaccharide transport system ATP-binding protein